MEPSRKSVRFSTTKDIPVKKLDMLFTAIGWAPRGGKKWKTILDKSTYVVSVWEDEKVVGLGRILEDGVMCMLYDICVHPDYQGQGIGRQIMDLLIAQVKGKRYASIGLFAWEGNPSNISFYEKFGFVTQSSGMELVKYMKRE